MSKQTERHSDFDFDDDADQAMIEDLDLDDEEAFFAQFQPQKSRRKSKRSRDARRRIEEYWEDRQLAERLRDYH